MTDDVVDADEIDDENDDDSGEEVCPFCGRGAYEEGACDDGFHPDDE